MSIIKIITYLFIFYVYNIYSINLIDNHFPLSNLNLEPPRIKEINDIKKGVIKINYIKKDDTKTHSIFGFYSLDQILVDNKLFPKFSDIKKLWFNTTYDKKNYELFDTIPKRIQYGNTILNISFTSSTDKDPFSMYLYAHRSGYSWPNLLSYNSEEEFPTEANIKIFKLFTIFKPLIGKYFEQQYTPQIGTSDHSVHIVDIINSLKNHTAFTTLIVGNIQSPTTTEEVRETPLANITSNGKLYYMKISRKILIFGIAKIGVLSDLDLGSSLIICVKKCRLGGFISAIEDINLDKDIATNYGVNVTENDEKVNATIFSIDTVTGKNISETNKIQGGISFAYTITDLNTGEIKSLDLIPKTILPITSFGNNKMSKVILGMQQDSNKSKETPTHDITPRLVLPNETQPSTSLNSLGIRHVQPTNQLSESSESTNQQGIKRPRTDDKTTTTLPTKQLYKVPNQVNITTDQQGIKRPRTDNKTQQTHPTKQLYKVPNKVNQQGIKRSRTDNETTTDPTKQLYKVPNQVNITTDQQGIKRSRTDNETTTDPTKQLYKVPNKVNITTDQQGIKRPRTDDRQPFEDDNPPSPDYFSDSDRGPLNVINESK